MNKRKRMAALKHRKHLRKLKERRRLQALAGTPVGIAPELVEEIVTAEAALTPAPRKRVVRKKEPEAVAPTPKKVVKVAKTAKVSKAEEKPEPKKRGRKKKETKSEG